jgi:hypothetical protein
MVAVIVSERLVLSAWPVVASAEKGMVTAPAALESPELTPRNPVGAVKLIFCPAIGTRNGSITVAVIVVEFEPSVFIEGTEAPSSRDMEDDAVGSEVATVMTSSAVALVPETSALTMSVWSV